MGWGDFFGGPAAGIQNQITNYVRQQQKPQMPQYSNDPNQFQGFDNSGLARQLEQNIRQSQARGQQGLMARASKMNPYGAGSSRNRASALMAAQGDRDVNLMQAGMARQTWEDKVAALNRHNQMLQNLYEMQSDDYDRMIESDEREKQRKEKMFSDILNAGSMGFGSYLGGK